MQIGRDSGQQDRFLASVLQLTARQTAQDIPRIALAVSGGPDSIALLLLAQESLPRKIAVATVAHGLRPEATAEAEYVASLCAERDIPHMILQPARPITGNIQSEARKARYALLEQWATEQNCDWIATAHHADDQLETMLMRLSRGSGVDGLSGVRAKNGNIIRPLLGFTKAELIDICGEAGVETIADASNENTDFDRVRMRQWLAISGHPFDAKTAATSAAALAEASAAIDWTVAMLAGERISQDGAMVTLNVTDLPNEYTRRLTVQALAMIDPDYAPRGPAISRLLHSLREGKTTTIGDILCSGDHCRDHSGDHGGDPSGNLWHFTPAPARGAR